jgi:hypothetical protein
MVSANTAMHTIYGSRFGFASGLDERRSISRLLVGELSFHSAYLVCLPVVAAYRDRLARMRRVCSDAEDRGRAPSPACGLHKVSSVLKGTGRSVNPKKSGAKPCYIELFDISECCWLNFFCEGVIF